MLVIRDRQLDSFPSGLDIEFELLALKTLRDLFPEINGNGGMNDAELMRVVKFGATNASEYGIDDQENVLLYLSFMFLFGFCFDDNPDLPWASEILLDPALESVEKMDRLFEIGSAIEASLDDDSEVSIEAKQ